MKSSGDLVLKEFNINPPQFYYQYNKVFRQDVTLDEMLGELDQAGCEVRTEPYPPKPNQLPTLLFLISPHMKCLYGKYGRRQFMSIDSTLNLFRETDEEGNSFKLAYCISFSGSRKIISFCLFVVN